MTMNLNWMKFLQNLPQTPESDDESNPSKSTTCDHSRSKVFDDGHNFSLDEQTESSMAVGDVTMASASLENTEVVSSPTCYLPEPETSLENSLELQADRVGSQNHMDSEKSNQLPFMDQIDQESKVLPPQNPFLPLTSEEGEKFQHVSGPVMGNVVDPAPYSLQVSHDRPGSNHFASEGEKVQTGSNLFTRPSSECTTSTHDPESSHGSIIQPVQQVTPETAPPMVEQPQHSMPISGGETAWSSHNSAVMSDCKVGRCNGVPVTKLPRPIYPLIDAVASHGQSKFAVEKSH
ncbi:protein SCAR2-like [Pyrus ussuriensis x Pyrus communis]|uniref:Protein SCAR2-like n=1 Tax=Pyrus ussuriensis x Pyrus communis TaxID=2448454 RepID=A0A5N5HUC6_9ROSA|nr:protein SCAR2-like [Pyrus ussuriensis x Pyrus communis]